MPNERMIGIIVLIIFLVLVLLVDEHRFNRDWKAAHKG